MFYADKVGLDRQFPVTPVDKHRKLNSRRPAEVHNRVHGSGGYDLP